MVRSRAYWAEILLFFKTLNERGGGGAPAAPVSDPPLIFV